MKSKSLAVLMLCAFTCVSAFARQPNKFDLADAYKKTNGISKQENDPPFAFLGAALINTAGATVFDANHPEMAMLAITAVTPYSPLTGATVTASPLKKSETIYLTPAGTIAALTVVFPTNANSQNGQVFRVVSTQIVTALTVTSTGLTLQGTAVTALAVNTPVSWLKVAASTWLRLN